MLFGVKKSLYGCSECMDVHPYGVLDPVSEIFRYIAWREVFVHYI